MDIASLSGVMGDSHNISAIISSAQSPPHMQSSLQITSSPVYLKLCHSILQLSATKCLHTLLFDEGTVTLLLDHTSSHPVVDHTSPQHPNPHCGSVSQSASSHQVTVPQQGSSRGENMTSVLRILVGHLAQCAIQPSPLRPALTMAELDRLHSVLVCETLRNVAEREWGGKKNLLLLVLVLCACACQFMCVCVCGCGTCDFPLISLCRSVSAVWNFLCE